MSQQSVASGPGASSAAEAICRPHSQLLHFVRLKDGVTGSVLPPLVAPRVAAAPRRHLERPPDIARDDRRQLDACALAATLHALCSVVPPHGGREPRVGYLSRTEARGGWVIRTRSPMASASEHRRGRGAGRRPGRASSLRRRLVRLAPERTGGCAATGGIVSPARRAILCCRARSVVLGHLRLIRLARNTHRRGGRNRRRIHSQKMLQRRHRPSAPPRSGRVRKNAVNSTERRGVGG